MKSKAVQQLSFRIMQKYQPNILTERLPEEPVLALIDEPKGRSDTLLNELSAIIGVENVFDLSLLGPECILSNPRYGAKDKFSYLLVSGDDKCLSMVVSALEKLGLLGQIALVPLPTTEDSNLARFLGWNRVSILHEGNLRGYIEHVRQAYPISVDVWHLNIKRAENSRDQRQDAPCIFLAYLCIGYDADRMLRVNDTLHESHHRYPLLQSEAYKTVQHLGKYMKQLVMSSLPNHSDLSSFVELECDGLSVNERMREIKPDTLLLLNTNSYHGNSHPWGYHREWDTARYLSKWKRPQVNDGYLEVIAYSSRRSLDIWLGGRGHRLSQCQRAAVTLKNDVPMCVDGSVHVLEKGTRIEVVNRGKRVQTLTIWDGDGTYSPIRDEDTSADASKLNLRRTETR